jgi:hypothetical protein
MARQRLQAARGKECLGGVERELKDTMKETGSPRKVRLGAFFNPKFSPSRRPQNVLPRCRPAQAVVENECARRRRIGDLEAGGRNSGGRTREHARNGRPRKTRNTRKVGVAIGDALSVLISNRDWRGLKFHAEARSARRKYRRQKVETQADDGRGFVSGGWWVVDSG